MTTITDEPFRADVDEVLARYGLDDPGHAVLASDLSDAFDEAIRDAAAEVERLRAEIASYRDHPGREYCHYCHAIFDVPSEAADNHWRECQSHPLRAEVERLTKERNEQAALVVHLHEWKEKAMKAYRDPSALAAVPAPQPQADDRMAVAERAALLMRMEATRIAGRVIEQAGLKIGSAIVDDIRNLNAAAVARRAVEEQEKP